MNIFKKKSFNVNKVMNKLSRDLKICFAYSDMELDYIKYEQSGSNIILNIHWYNEYSCERGIYIKYMFRDLELLENKENYEYELNEIWEVIENE